MVSLRAAWYKPIMQDEIECVNCGKKVTPKTGNQQTCLAHECQLRLRAMTRSKTYYERRPDPICVRCGEPIKDARKRKYHSRCRRQKERDRVAAYFERTKGRPKIGKSKPRNYKGKIRCMICRRLVKKTGARQIICKADECKRKLKSLRKRERRIERQEVPRRISETKKRVPPSKVTPNYETYKVAIGA